MCIRDSHYSYPLRVALIFAETRAWIGRKVKVSIGAPVVAVDLGDKAGAAARLRALCYGCLLYTSRCV